MNYCQKCGNALDRNAGFCSNCGERVANNNFAKEQTHINQNDNTKLMSILAYIIFFIPLIAGEHKKSDFVKFHVNQGTVLFIFVILWAVLSSLFPVSLLFMPLLGLVLSGISGLVGLALIALVILGIVNAANDKMKPLPLIGRINVIK